MFGGFLLVSVQTEMTTWFVRQCHVYPILILSKHNVILCILPFTKHVNVQILEAYEKQIESKGSRLVDKECFVSCGFYE